MSGGGLADRSEAEAAARDRDPDKQGRSSRRRPEEPADPRPLRDSLAEVSAELGLGSSDAFARLCARWSEVVGTDVAEHSRPRSLRDGVLSVAVDDAPWATRLRYLENQVIERATELVAPDALRAVRVTVSGANSGTLEESI